MSGTAYAQQTPTALLLVFPSLFLNPERKVEVAYPTLHFKGQTNAQWHQLPLEEKNAMYNLFQNGAFN